MRIYKIAQNFSTNKEIEKSNEELQTIIKNLEQEYPGLDLWIYENERKIELSQITVPLEMRHQGIGSKIIGIIKDFARKRGKPLVISPEAERGYKKKLEEFYRGHGFVHNKGRNRDYRISNPFGATMYWSP